MMDQEKWALYHELKGKRSSRSRLYRVIDGKVCGMGAETGSTQPRNRDLLTDEEVREKWFLYPGNYVHVPNAPLKKPIKDFIFMLKGQATRECLSRVLGVSSATIKTINLFYQPSSDESDEQHPSPQP